MIESEPADLSKVRALARCLEVEPLKLGVFLVAIGNGQLVLFVILVNNVLKDSVGLPIQRQ